MPAHRLFPISPAARARRGALLSLAVCVLAAAPAAEASETLTFAPEADTYVGADAPDATHGKSSGMSVDGSPAKQAFLRFSVSGIRDRTVTSARLKMRQTNASRIGGRVWAVSSDSWLEALTWDARPALDGPLLATYPPVERDVWYEVELGSGAVREGTVSFGIDSPSSDGARWATRESTTPPVLSVTVDDPEPVADSTTLTFAPEADTYVGADAPDATHGKSSGMSVDRSPAKQAFLRFRLTGIGDRTVTSARLKMRQTNASRTGGRVFGVSSNSWPEALVWDTRPALDGPLLATYPAVERDVWYEVELGAAAVRDGTVSFGIDSPSSDGARWATRESMTPPVLSVTVADPGTVVDGLSSVAAPTDGSSEPTYYSGNHRAAVTAGGRMLTVHGRHASGVQLAWRDPDGGWRTTSTGASSDGGILTGTGSGDWPASIALARDAAGAEHAWVVYSGQNASSERPFAMRRLSDLDAAGGPRIGPVVTIDSGAGGGTYRGDVALERAPDGTMRGVVLWSRRAGDSSFELVTKWFTDLGSDTPTLHDGEVIEQSTSSAHFGSLVATPAGTTVVARIGRGVLGSFSHASSAPLRSWSAGPQGPSISGRSAPTAVALANGAVLAAVERDSTNHVSGVYRLAPDGTSFASVLEVSGYAQPALAGDGTRAWLVAVRSSDGNAVSRAFDPAAGWSSIDRVEVGPEAGGYAWPNAVRDVEGRLRFVFEGVGTSANRSAVLAFQRRP